MKHEAMVEPQRGSPAAPCDAVPKDAPYDSLGVRILVADDNADMRDYLVRLMTDQWSVEAVADGEDALLAARRSRFDLVLTDVMMPRLDGFGLLRALRADPALRDIPVVMLSAHASEESRLEGFEHGADDYVIKPFSEREVIARVAVQLSRARGRARADARLRVLRAEHQTRILELHHRVKNNLEVVSSLLSLQADFLDDTRARQALAETCNRVRTIADIHHLLDEAPDLAQVDLAGFVRRLAEALFALYGINGDRVQLDLRVGPGGMDLERAVPFGLIVNELFCNALKHAFPNARRGTIQVTIDAARGVLQIADDGVGLPASLDPHDAPTLGLQLVTLLVRQIRGRMSIESGRGTRFNVEFP